jgi:putative oxidoreductase
MLNVNDQAVDLALLAFRLLLGGVFMAHGVNHIIGGGKISGTGKWFESLGMKPGWFHAWTASITEIVAALLLVVGLAVPLACGMIIGVMLVAWITNHRKNGFFTFRPGEGWEYVMVLTVCGFILAILGAGQWSLDNALGFTKLNGWIGLVVAAVVGIGGTFGLLGVFWRPEKKSA